MKLTVVPVPGPDAEDVAVAPFGAVYTGTSDGAVWRIAPDGAQVERVAHTGGRPLGIEVLPDGGLVVCDAERGLLRVDPATGEVAVLVDAAGAVPLRVCNNAAVAADGTIWFSDSSARFDLADWRSDLMFQTRSGRLLRRDPDGRVEVVLDGLAFANGVALSTSEDFVVVAETSARTVVRRWLTGPRAGMRDLLCADLPGYPDNVSSGSDGLLWVALPGPVEPLLERVQTSPNSVRKIAARLPERLKPSITRSLRVQAYDEDGVLVRDLDLTDQTGDGEEFHAVTGVREHDGRVWLSSFIQPAVAYVDL